MAMPDVPLDVSGPATIALIVVPGIFGYPWLLRRAGGRVVIGVATVLLAALFMFFEAGRASSTALSVALSGLLALAPLAAGIIVARLQKPASP
jgi:hypothetical protein